MIPSGTKVYGKGTNVPLTVMWQMWFPQHSEQSEPYYECWHIVGKAVIKHYLAESVLMATIADAKANNGDTD
jgi:hypothetical protein